MENVNLNLYGLNFQKPLEKKDDEKKPVHEEPNAPKGEDKAVSQETMLSAMQMAAMQNKALVGGAGAINPKDYLDAESIARIQASMGDFEATVDGYFSLADKEFGTLVSDDVKQEIALQAASKAMQ